jgi:hypothetical protein
MLLNIVSAAAFALVAAGILFQLLTLARLAARIARVQIAQLRPHRGPARRPRLRGCRA